MKDLSECSGRKHEPVRTRNFHTEIGRSSITVQYLHTSETIRTIINKLLAGYGCHLEAASLTFSHAFHRFIASLVLDFGLQWSHLPQMFAFFQYSLFCRTSSHGSCLPVGWPFTTVYRRLCHQWIWRANR